MAETPVDIDALAAQVTKQASLVRQLKKDGAPGDAVAAAVDSLKLLKEQFAKLNLAEGDAFDKKVFDDLVIRKMFVIPSFEIHGGVKGLFDLGPPGCALKVCLVVIRDVLFFLLDSLDVLSI